VLGLASSCIRVVEIFGVLFSGLPHLSQLGLFSAVFRSFQWDLVLSFSMGLPDPLVEPRGVVGRSCFSSGVF